MLNSRKRSLVVVVLSACSVALLSSLMALESWLRFDDWPDPKPPGSFDQRIGDLLFPDMTTEGGAAGRAGAGAPDRVLVPLGALRPAASERPSFAVQHPAAILVGGPGGGDIDGPAHTVVDFGPEPAEGEVFPPRPVHADVPTAVRRRRSATANEHRRAGRRDGESRRRCVRRGRGGGAEGGQAPSTLATRGVERSRPERTPTARPAAAHPGPARSRPASPAAAATPASAPQPTARGPQKASPGQPDPAPPSQASHGGTPHGGQPNSSHGGGKHGSQPKSWRAAIAEEIGRPVAYREVETDGARRAAEKLAELL